MLSNTIPKNWPCYDFQMHGGTLLCLRLFHLLREVSVKRFLRNGRTQSPSMRYLIFIA
jgi:hypothetical protein